MANDVAKILSKAPSWTSVSPGDDRARDQLLASLLPLVAKPTDEIRAGILEYVETLKSGDTLGELSKIYVLNRLLFRAPSDEDKSRAAFFGGWNGVPSKADKVDMMWPVGADSQGRLVIVGFFSGYFGEDYAPLAEFDHFRTKYGRRNEAKPEDKGQSKDKK